VDIDTRADIYALGVILYELLTGLRPFDGKRLRQASLDQVVHIIREEEPPRPSSRLATGDTLASAATARQTEPARLTALLRGDLDWIVMKCLEKDRSRRYESASSLSRDIERYLAHEPIEARPPSAVYKVRKFVRRNKVMVVAASLVLAALVVAVCGTTAGLIQARISESKAISERNEKEKQRQAADTARDEARRRAEQIEKGNKIISSIFDDFHIRGIKAETEPIEAVLAKRLATAGDLLEGVSLGDPLVVAQLQTQLGKALLSLGHAPESVGLFEKSRAARTAKFGADHLDSLQNTDFLAQAYQGSGQLGCPQGTKIRSPA
jgi:non-specific serine/threonine protein kinase/serine/threonine-protein kinase